MFSKVFSANDDWTGLVLRIPLGFVLSAHGAQKLLGWFGGYGFEGTMQFFTDTMHLPWLLGFAVILLESFGALLLIAGLASRLLAAAMVLLFTGILFTSHLQYGFFMNWFGNQAGEGIEFRISQMSQGFLARMGKGQLYFAPADLAPETLLKQGLNLGFVVHNQDFHTD